MGKQRPFILLILGAAFFSAFFFFLGVRALFSFYLTAYINQGRILSADWFALSERIQGGGFWVAFFMAIIVGLIVAFVSHFMTKKLMHSTLEFKERLQRFSSPEGKALYTLSEKDPTYFFKARFNEFASFVLSLEEEKVRTLQRIASRCRAISEKLGREGVAIPPHFNEFLQKILQ